MRKFLVLLFLFNTRIITSAQFSTDTSSLHSASENLAIKITPFTLARNMWFTAHVEYAFHPQFSISLGISPNFLAKGNSYQRDSILNINGTDTSYFDYVKSKGYPGFSLDPEIRWYPKGAWNGWFFGLYSSQRFSSTKLLEQQYISQVVSPGIQQYVPVNPGNYQMLKTHVGVMGFQMGYVAKWGTRKQWFLDAFTGLGIKTTTYRFTNFGSLYPDTNTSKPGIAGRFNFSIGYILK